MADLQLHTPVDRNFRLGKGTHLEKEERRQVFAASYIERVLAAGLGVIAITEHNDVTWIDLLREASQGADLLIFPAFEVASSEGVHVLCLWEPEEQTRRLDERLTEMGLPNDRRWHPDRSPRLSSLPLQSLVKFVHERGGLCILSHVDREDGVLHRFKGEPRVQAWLESGALAVQCAKNPRLMDESFCRRALLNEGGKYKRPRPYACIQTSDARSLDEIGSKPTYVKMSSDSIEGLRQAFFDAGSRIRFPDEHKDRTYPKLLAAQWDGAFLEAALPVNRNLNCLIGGKGTAKSTAIETIRHAFDIPIESQAVSDAATALLAETFPSSAKLSLLVEVARPHPARYIIERTGQDRPLVRAVGSGEIVEGLEPSSLFRPIIFGQKEIYETAQRIDSQLKLLDRYCAAELEPLQDQDSALVADIKAKSEEIRRLSATLAKLEDRLTELPALRERKRLFDEAGLAEKLAEQRQLERERAALKLIDQSLSAHEALLTDVQVQLPDGAAVEDLGESPNADLIQAAGQLPADVVVAWKKALGAVDRTMSAARKRLTEIQTLWQSRFDEQRSAFDKAVKDVAGEHGEGNIRDYLQLDAKIDELNVLQREKKSRAESVRAAKKKRLESVTALREVRRRVFQVRDRTARNLTSRLDDAVRISVRHQANRERVLVRLKGLKSGVGGRQLEELVSRDDFSPARLAELLRGKLDDLATELGISDGLAQQLARAVDDEKIDALETLSLEDRVEISLNVGSAERAEFRPLDRLSAGQRSTAILLLALLESDGPLILDQPEDDLDNRFIYEDVVQRLRTAKEQRQFIIATHNANIPVLGDAEQIIVLDTEVIDDRMHAVVVARGSIDDKRLHGPLEDVLEGGREAFERRKEKYGF